MTIPDQGGDPDSSYEVYAIKYAEADALPADKVAIGSDPHETPARDMAYYVWLIRRADVAIVVDTGFNVASGARRGHHGGHRCHEASGVRGQPPCARSTRSPHYARDESDSLELLNAATAAVSPGA